MKIVDWLAVSVFGVVCLIITYFLIVSANFIVRLIAFPS
jgi:hypothetical protein